MCKFVDNTQPWCMDVCKHPTVYVSPKHWGRHLKLTHTGKRVQSWLL